MDSNANLQEQGRLLTKLVMLSGESVHEWRRRVYHDRMRLTELRHALTVWLEAGGFAPDWTKEPIAAKYYRKGSRS